MKLITTLAITVVAVAAGSAAYARDCGSPPAKLALPDGATADEPTMKATQAKFPPYAKAMSTYLQCLAAEIKSGKDEYDQVAADWQAQQKKFNATPAKQ
jgi:hypothetical protein